MPDIFTPLTEPCVELSTAELDDNTQTLCIRVLCACGKEDHTLFNPGELGYVRAQIDAMIEHNKETAK